MIVSVNKKNFHFSLFAGLFVFFISLAISTEQYLWTLLPFAVLIIYWGWQYLNILFLILLLVLPFSTEYNFSSELSTDIPDELLMISLAILSFCYFIYSPGIFPKYARHHPLMIFLVIGLVWTLLTVFFSSHQVISLKYFLAKCWYIGAFVLAPIIVFKQKEIIKKSAIILAVSMFVVVAIILIRHAGYGFRFADINKAIAPFFRNHVDYAAMLVCIIPLFFEFYKMINKKQNRIYIVVAIIILATALFFSYSRGAWVALFAGVFSYWLIRKKLLFKSFIAAFIITLGFLFWLKNNDRYLQFAHDYKTTIFHKNFKEHLVATYKLKDVSTAERFYRWIAGIRMIKDNSLTGYGPGTFYYNYKPYAVPAFKTWVSDNKEHSTVHNYFLLMIIEQGLPGLIFFLLLLGGSLFYAQKLYHRIEDKFYKPVAATTGVVLTMLIVVNFLSDLVETDKIGSIFFLCIATLIATDINTRKDSNSSADIQSIS